MAVNPARLPNESAPIAGTLLIAQEWRDFFLTLADEADTESMQEEYLALAERVTALEAAEAEDGYTGQYSVQIVGNTIRLKNDTNSPGGSSYYGTDVGGINGWHSRDLATLADVDPTTPFALGDAPVFDGTLFQPTAVLANPMTTLGDIITADVGGIPQRLPVGADGDVLTITAGEPGYATPVTPVVNTRGITVTGGSFSGDVIDAASIVGGFAASDYTLTGNWYLWCSPSGSIELDVRAAAFGSIPPNSGDSLCGGNEPAVAGAISASGNFAGWSTAIARGDALSVVVNSVTDVTWFVLLLEAV